MSETDRIADHQTEQETLRHKKIYTLIDRQGALLLHPHFTPMPQMFNDEAYYEAYEAYH